MKGNPLNPDTLDPHEPTESAECFFWQTPRREIRPVGFGLQNQHEAFSNVAAITVKDVAKLSAEVAEMRAQFSKALSVIEQKLSLGNDQHTVSRRKKSTRKPVRQTTLPLIPAELFPITDAIERSKQIFRPPALSDTTDEPTLSCSQDTWERATTLLINHALVILEKLNVTIQPPMISAGPDGSVDLYWASNPYGLLLNVPADAEQPATFFGDDAANPDSNHTSGKINSARPIDVGVLMWLAHTTEQ